MSLPFGALRLNKWPIPGLKALQGSEVPGEFCVQSTANWWLLIRNDHQDESIGRHTLGPNADLIHIKEGPVAILNRLGETHETPNRTGGGFQVRILGNVRWL